MNITRYINDFMNFQGNSDERKEYLETKYKRLAPQENYLVYESDSGKILFHVQDIALLTGRDSSSISRTLSQINALEGWCSRLLAIREEANSANNNKIFVYDAKIFDLIIDFRESKYLERYKLHGNSEYSEVLRYWEYLKQLDEIKSKSQNQSTNKIIESDSELFTAPDLPYMSWRDVLKLTGSKLFTIRADMIFVMIFGVSFMFARKWPALIPVFAGMSLMSLLACLGMLRVRAGNANLISDFGAVSTLLVIFWGINLTIENAIYTPGGTILTLEHEPLITLQPVRVSGSKPLAFSIIAENQSMISEIFYKYDQQREYKSTGFIWSGSPNLLLEPDKQSGMLNISLKYRDSENKEHEPLAFAFDLGREYFSASKNLILNEKDFIMIKRVGDVLKINAIVNDSVKAVVYGINTLKPDITHEIRKVDSKYMLESENLLTTHSSSVEVEYVSSYIIFRDETSSDVRIIKNPPADDSNRGNVI